MELSRHCTSLRRLDWKAFLVFVRWEVWVGRVGAKWETGKAAAAEGRPWRLPSRWVVGGKLRGKSDCELSALTCHPLESIIANSKKYPLTPRKAQPMLPVTLSSCRCPLLFDYTTRDVLPFRDRAFSDIYEIISARATSRRQQLHEYVVVGRIPRNLPAVSRFAKTLNETFCPSLVSVTCSRHLSLQGRGSHDQERPGACCVLLPPLLIDFLKQAKIGVVGKKKAAGGTHYQPGQSKGVASAANAK